MESVNLIQIFQSLVEKYTDNHLIIEILWNKINKSYSHKCRHYHTLIHLENLYLQLLPIQDKFQNWDIVLFALFYHDIIYNTLKSDNEVRSAELARQKLSSLNLSKNEINLCYEMILATKKHDISPHSDINYFTDADLSILGADSLVYEQYFKDVRKEFFIYPTFLYQRGRKKVLQHFLSMERIFKTDYFYDHFEQQARANIQNEIVWLS